MTLELVEWTLFARIIDCERCGGTHDKLRVLPLLRDLPPYEFWACCPTSGEPIMLRRTDLPTMPGGGAVSTSGATTPSLEDDK